MKNYNLCFAVALMTIFVLHSASKAHSAEPYLTPQRHCDSLNLPSVKVPTDTSSGYFPSDACDVIFIAPPRVLEVKIAAVFAGIRKDRCDVVLTTAAQIDRIDIEQVRLVNDILEGTIDLKEAQKTRELIDLAKELLEENLELSYSTHGAEISMAISQPWQEEVQAYNELNNRHYRVLPLPTVAGLITFDEKRTELETNILGVYPNEAREPWLEYSISGLKPVDPGSTLLDQNALPIFFPTARAARSGLQVIEFGGGAVTANVRLNPYGYCLFITEADDATNPATPLQIQANYLFAIKVAGTYTISIDSTFMLDALKSLRNSRTGTAHASVWAHEFFKRNDEQSVQVVFDDDVRNSLGHDINKEDALRQVVLQDVANQFLTAATGEYGQRRTIELPETTETETYETLEQVREVCRRKSILFGLFSNQKCFDQVYNVKVLQNTSQYQEAERRVSQVFSGTFAAQRAQYILVPAQASIGG